MSLFDLLLAAAPIGAAEAAEGAAGSDQGLLTTDIPTWLLVFGFAAQALFFMRFLVQWIHSERQKRSEIPIAFWWFSLCGGVMLFSYAAMRKDPVIMLGQSMGVLIYTRNLMLIYRARKQHPELLPGGEDEASSG